MMKDGKGSDIVATILGCGILWIVAYFIPPVGILAGVMTILCISILMFDI